MIPGWADDEPMRPRRLLDGIHVGVADGRLEVPLAGPELGRCRFRHRESSCSPNDPAQQRGGTGELEVPETIHAPPSAAAPGSASAASAHS